MAVTAAIQYVLTSAQSFGPQDYYNKCLMSILGIAGVLLCKNEQTWTKWIIAHSEENAKMDA